MGQTNVKENDSEFIRNKIEINYDSGESKNKLLNYFSCKQKFF